MLPADVEEAFLTFGDRKGNEKLIPKLWERDAKSNFSAMTTTILSLFCWISWSVTENNVLSPRELCADGNRSNLVRQTSQYSLDLESKN